MRVLCVDTSSELAVVGVGVDDALAACVVARMRHRHGESLLAQIEHALSLAAVRVADVDLVTVGLGPGSFTGVRIGLATAKGIALARSTPLVGVSTSRALARAASGRRRGVVVDAGKGELFVAAYEFGDDGELQTLLEDRSEPPEVAASTLAAILERGVPGCVVGSGLAQHRAVLAGRLGAEAVLGVAHWAPSAEALTYEGVSRFRAQGGDDPASLVPVYARGADARPLAGFGQALAGASTDEARAPR